MIDIKVFSKNGCRYCGPVLLFLSEKETELTNATITYTNIDELLPEVRGTVIAKYKIQSAPTLIFERNGHEMARSSGITAIESFEDCLQYAREAK